MKTKRELIDAAEALRKETGANLPRHADIDHIYGSHNKIRLSDTSGDPARVWDIKRANQGWAYFETDESGRISHSYLRAELTTLLNFAWARFKGVADATTNETAEPLWHKLFGSERGRHAYEATVPGHDLFVIRLFTDTRRRHDTTAALYRKADKRVSRDEPIPNDDLVLQCVVEAEMTTEEAQRWAVSAVARSLRELHENVRKMETDG